MNPYESPADELDATDALYKRAPSRQLRLASAIVGASVATLSLIGWACKIIYYIITVYQPPMGFWAIRLLGIAVLSAPLAAFVVYRCSHCCSARLAIVPHVISALALAFVFSVTVAVVSWIESFSQLFFMTYGIILLGVLPSCLLGFTVSGPVVWFGLFLRTSECTRVERS